MTTVTIMRETYDEALSALYGAREVLGAAANIQHAIELLEAALDEENHPTPYQTAYTAGERDRERD